MGLFVSMQIVGKGILGDVKLLNGLMIKLVVAILLMDFLTITLLDIN